MMNHQSVEKEKSSEGEESMEKYGKKLVIRKDENGGERAE